MELRWNRPYLHWHHWSCSQTTPDLKARPLVFVYRPIDGERREALRRLYPDGETRVFPQSSPERNFVVYVVR